MKFINRATGALLGIATGAITGLLFIPCFIIAVPRIIYKKEKSLLKTAIWTFCSVLPVASLFVPLSPLLVVWFSFQGMAKGNKKGIFAACIFPWTALRKQIAEWNNPDQEARESFDSRATTGGNTANIQRRLPAALVSRRADYSDILPKIPEHQENTNSNYPYKDDFYATKQCPFSKQPIQTLRDPLTIEWPGQTENLTCSRQALLAHIHLCQRQKKPVKYGIKNLSDQDVTFKLGFAKKFKKSLIRQSRLLPPQQPSPEKQENVVSYVV